MKSILCKYSQLKVSFYENRKNAELVFLNVI